MDYVKNVTKDRPCHTGTWDDDGGGGGMNIKMAQLKQYQGLPLQGKVLTVLFLTILQKLSPP